MNTTINQSTETFNTMHKLEQARVPRTQAEMTARAIEKQVSISRQEVLDKIDARFDAFEKRLSWLYAEIIVSIRVIGAGFTGVIIALLRMG